MQFSRPLMLPLVLFVACGTTPLTAGAQQASAFDLTLHRTRGQAQMTAVDAVAEIDPRGLFSGDNCSYRVEVVISEPDGEAPVEDEWRRTVSCESVRQNPGTRLIDTFSFAVLPGEYEVEMTVHPSGQGEPRAASARLESLPADARLSDLYLAREVGWDAEGEAEWPLRKGGIGIAAEAIVDIPSSRPFLAYYMELYESGAARVDGTVTGAILRPGGATVTEFTLQTIDTLVSDRPVAGTVSLAGLPLGAYEFAVRVAFEGQPASERRQPFRLIREEAAAEALARQQPGELERYFAQLSDSVLNRLDAVVLWLPPEEGRDEYRSLSADAKRRFLTEYFSRNVIVTPAGKALASREALRTLVRRVNEADRLFGGPGENARPGWQTDRGRLYVRLGAPADRISRPFPSNDTRPYEIWYYSQGRGLVYLFSDESGFGQYRMLYSTDPTQPSTPDWRRRAGPEAVRELATYYGIRER